MPADANKPITFRHGWSVSTHLTLCILWLLSPFAWQVGGNGYRWLSEAKRRTSAPKRHMFTHRWQSPVAAVAIMTGGSWEEIQLDWWVKKPLDLNAAHFSKAWTSRFPQFTTFTTVTMTTKVPYPQQSLILTHNMTASDLLRLGTVQRNNVVLLISMK